MNSNTAPLIRYPRKKGVFSWQNVPYCRDPAVSCQ